MATWALVSNAFRFLINGIKSRKQRKKEIKIRHYATLLAAATSGKSPGETVKNKVQVLYPDTPEYF